MDANKDENKDEHKDENKEEILRILQMMETLTERIMEIERNNHKWIIMTNSIKEIK